MKLTKELTQQLLSDAADHLSVQASTSIEDFTNYVLNLTDEWQTVEFLITLVEDNCKADKLNRRIFIQTPEVINARKQILSFLINWHASAKNE